MSLPEGMTGKQFARDVVEGRVFGTWSLSEHDHNLIPSIFMPLMFGAEFAKDTVHLYEYYSEAGPRGINGKPMFTSCRGLIREEAAQLQIDIDEYEEVMKQYEQPTESPSK